MTPFAATWVDLEIVILSKVRQRGRNIVWHPLYTESKKKKKWRKRNYLQNRNRFTGLENNLMVVRGRMGGWDSQGVRDQHVHFDIFKMDNQKGPTVWHRELCSRSCGSLDWGRMYTCICMTESLCCPPETITTLLISYTQIQTKKLLFKVNGGKTHGLTFYSIICHICYLLD